MTEHNDSDQWIIEFLKQWFLGLSKGLEGQSQQVHADILKFCGIACAHPQAANFFRKAWQRSENLDKFILTLNQHYQQNVFVKKHEFSIQVQYSKCYCPLRQLKLVTSSIFRDCSRSWLQEVFESALSIPVHVKTVKTMCSGANSCLFIVTFPSMNEKPLLEFQIYLKEALKLRQQVDKGLIDF